MNPVTFPGGLMISFRAVLAILVLLSLSPAGQASGLLSEDGLLAQDAWAADELTQAVNDELRTLDARKAAAVAAYAELQGKLGQYHGWCSTYGITALRKVIEGRLYGRMFSFLAYPLYHVYSNDPYFAGARGQVDRAFGQLRTTSVDVGKCSLTEEMWLRMGRDPKHFDPSRDDFAGTSFPYALLAGNFRLIEEERAVLLELRGVLAGAKKDPKAVEEFVARSYQRLNEQTGNLRARTLQGFEMSFRVPLGPLESYKGKAIGQAESDQIPNFFFIFERRTFYVNQARLAAGKLFQVSVDHFTAADGMLDRFLKIIQEAN